MDTRRLLASLGHELPPSRTTTNRKRLAEINYPKEKIPPHFLDFFDEQVMEHPVYLDDPAQNNIVDFDNLLKFWAADKNQSGINPFTFAPVQSITVCEDLKKLIHDFVNFEVNHSLPRVLSANEVQKALIKMNELIAEFDHPQTCAERIKKEKLTPELLEEFTAQNLNGEIINHPIRLDGKDVVDYQALMEYWSTPENQYKNFYTGRGVISLAYDSALKYKLEKYCADEPRNELPKLRCDQLPLIYRP